MAYVDFNAIADPNLSGLTIVQGAVMEGGYDCPKTAGPGARPKSNKTVRRD